MAGPYVAPATVHVPVATVPPTKIPAGWGLIVNQDLEALAKPPRVRVARTTNQSIPNATATAVSWSSQTYDKVPGESGATGGTGTAWTSGANLVAPIAGIYTAAFGGQFAANAGGTRLLYFILLGTGAVLGNPTILSPSAGFLAGGQVLLADQFLAAGDVLNAMVFQSSGGALNLDVTYAVWASLRLVAL